MYSPISYISSLTRTNDDDANPSNVSPMHRTSASNVDDSPSQSQSHTSRSTSNMSPNNGMNSNNGGNHLYGLEEGEEDVLASFLGEQSPAAGGGTDDGKHR